MRPAVPPPPALCILSTRYESLKAQTVPAANTGGWIRNCKTNGLSTCSKAVVEYNRRPKLGDLITAERLDEFVRDLV